MLQNYADNIFMYSNQLRYT